MMGNLLFKLAPFSTEGPNGYLLRLADANKLQLADLSAAGVGFDPDALARGGLLPERELNTRLWQSVTVFAELMRSKSRVWNKLSSRFCPSCLLEEPTWRAEWELYFYDACAVHHGWMIDRCSSCGSVITWKRSQLLRCRCGADFRAERLHSAPREVIDLSDVISNKLHGIALHEVKEPLRSLDVDQVQRLIRYLGMHLDPAGTRKTLKLNNAGRMDASWPVTSTAAAMLADWPRFFHDRFSAIQRDREGYKSGLPQTFCRAYSYLYKGLKEPAFQPVRDAFEAWLAQHWQGGIALRNRRLAARVINDVQWIAAGHAADRLGVPLARIRQLVSEGVIDGNETRSPKGRRFLMVRREEIEALNYEDLAEVNLNTAIERLGLGKVRMRELLRLLFPGAYRRYSAVGYAPWRISRQEMERYLEIGTGLPTLTIAQESQISLSHVLKYWVWTTNEIVDLIENVRDGHIQLEAMLEGPAGLARWVFDRRTLVHWKQSRAPNTSNWLSVPEVAKALGIKQEVAYWLVRNEFIKAEVLRPRTGCGAQVSRKNLELFRNSYVFATEIAEPLRTSSRKVIAILAKSGFLPASGQEVEKCGKIFYARTAELEAFLLDLNVALFSSSRTEK